VLESIPSHSCSSYKSDKGNNAATASGGSNVQKNERRLRQQHIHLSKQ